MQAGCNNTAGGIDIEHGEFRRHHETYGMCAEDFLRSKEKKAPKLKSTTIKTLSVQCVLETANSSQYA